jgi:hypothetical protein
MRTSALLALVLLLGGSPVLRPVRELLIVFLPKDGGSGLPGDGGIGLDPDSANGDGRQNMDPNG